MAILRTPHSRSSSGYVINCNIYLYSFCILLHLRTYLIISSAIQDAYPERFIECYIAEQNMVGVAVGAACRDRTVPFVSTFAAFFSRAYDQLRMAAVSQTNINLCGSHCGVSIG